MMRIFAISAALLWLCRRKQRSVEDAIDTLHAADHIPIDVPTDQLAPAAEAAASAGVPVGWVLEARKCGACDLHAAAARMSTAAQLWGAPHVRDAASWRAAVIAEGAKA